LNARIVDTQEEWAAELDLSQQLQEIGVEMSSGYAYHNETAGWFRVIFSVEREILEEGLSRFVSTLSKFMTRDVVLKKPS
jgi:1-aminocyclopropane-1-carboxylate synthase